ncbi:hypothetical protein ACLOJK_035533 [Asimina triloba]
MWCRVENLSGDTNCSAGGLIAIGRIPGTQNRMQKVGCDVLLYVCIQGICMHAFDTISIAFKVLLNVVFVAQFFEAFKFIEAMIVAALLTSLGINVALCILFFSLYSILRKQPGNSHVYAPRLVAQGKSQEESRFDLERLLPSPGWVRTAWRLSEEQLLSMSGLDAVVYMRIFIFSLRIFSIAGIIGIFILLPVNYFGDQLNDIDFSDLPKKSLERFTISNVKDGSKWLWVHFCAAYIITGVICFLLYYIGRAYDSKKIYKQLTHLKSRPGKRVQRDGFLGIFGRHVDAISHTEKRLEELEENVRIHQSNVSLIAEEVPAAFVCFKSRYGAAIALNIQQGTNPTQWVTEQAPEPNDVYWPFLSARFLQIWISKFVVFVASVFLAIIFLIPVVFVQGLANLNQLQILLPFLKKVLAIQIEKSACGKVLWFTIWNIFFANVLSGSAINQLQVVLDPKNIPLRLAAAVPAQATFFITYVLTSGWTSLASEIARAIPLLCDFIGRCCPKGESDEFEVPSIPYHEQIPKILLFGLLGISYFLLAPLILPFLLAYYGLGYIVYRNQFLNVYSPKFETGGKFWPIVHDGTIFSLVLMHAIAIGIFGLKKLPLASSLTLPLPSLIKKDREDLTDPAMGELFDKLTKAYEDPTMQRVKYSESTDEHISPLLGSSGV